MHWESIRNLECDVCTQQESSVYLSFSLIMHQYIDYAISELTFVLYVLWCMDSNSKDFKVFLTFLCHMSRLRWNLLCSCNRVSYSASETSLSSLQTWRWDSLLWISVMSYRSSLTTVKITLLLLSGKVCIGNQCGTCIQYSSHHNETNFRLIWMFVF